MEFLQFLPLEFFWIRSLQFISLDFTRLLPIEFLSFLSLELLRFLPMLFLSVAFNRFLPLEFSFSRLFTLSRFILRMSLHLNFEFPLLHLLTSSVFHAHSSFVCVLPIAVCSPLPSSSYVSSFGSLVLISPFSSVSSFHFSCMPLSSPIAQEHSDLVQLKRFVPGLLNIAHIEIHQKEHDYFNAVNYCCHLSGEKHIVYAMP